MEEKPGILLIEIDSMTSQLVTSKLGSFGYEIVSTDGNNLELTIKQRRFKLILLGSQTSWTLTLELLQSLKREKGLGTIPIVLLTERTEPELRRQMLEAGADDFLIKPIDEFELQARVVSLLKVKAYNDQANDFQRLLDEEVTKKTRELTRLLERVKVTSLDTVYRLSRAAEYKDEATGAHVQRMSHYSSAIARAIGLDNTYIENILWAAPMHDIGKIGIPDNILLKPGKLDDNEWVIMKQHTTIGAEILKDADADFIILAADIALTHHEKWTGGGYPRGIKGQDIPLAGRIVALADVFDALTTERPYKKPMPLEQAYGIIKEGKGTHFDPQVVDAFFTIEEEIQAELNWWKFMSSSGPTEDTDLSNLFK